MFNLKLRKFEWVIFVIIVFMVGIGVVFAQDARIPRRLVPTPVTCSLVFAAADTTKTCTIDDTFFGTSLKDAELHSFKLVLPNWAGNGTATVSFNDPAGGTIYTQATIAENSTNYYQTTRPFEMGSSFVILLSTTAGTGGGTVTITPWVYK